MRGAVIYGPGDVRFEQRADPKIIEPGDAIIRMSATCVCGSDLWDYRGINPVTAPTPIGHVAVRGGPVPARRFLPELIALVCDRKIDPGRVFDLTLPLDQVAQGYRAMDERRAIKTLLCP